MTSDVNKFYIKFVALDDIQNFVVYNFYIWAHLPLLKCIGRQLKNTLVTSSIQGFKMELSIGPNIMNRITHPLSPKSKRSSLLPLSLSLSHLSLSLSLGVLDDDDVGGRGGVGSQGGESFSPATSLPGPFPLPPSRGSSPPSSAHPSSEQIDW